MNEYDYDNKMILASPDEQINSFLQFPYGKLIKVLVATQGLSLIAQTSHWAAKGTNFYQEHLLFERVYNTVSGHIDAIAEKCVGLNKNGMVVEPCALLNANLEFVEAFKSFNQSDLTTKVYSAVCVHKKITTKVYEELKADGLMTGGIENLIQSLLDDIEQLEYLLGRIQDKIIG